MRDALGLGGSDDLAVEGCDRAAGVLCGGKTVGVGEADRVAAAEACRLDADRLARLVDRDAERSDRLARGSKPPAVGGWSDKHLGEVDDADQPRHVLLLPAHEEGARRGMVKIRAIKRADQDVSVEHDFQRRSSSASSRSR